MPLAQATVVAPPPGGLPDWLSYTAIAWAGGVTTTVTTLVMTGKIVLGRELAREKKATDDMEALWKEEKAHAAALRETLDKNNVGIAELRGLLAESIAGLQQLAMRQRTLDQGPSI